MIWKRLCLPTLTIILLGTSLSACLVNRQVKDKPEEIYLLRKGDPAPIDGILVSRNYMWRIIQKVGEK
jgi:hypothetical protein